jgi:hypothetical protein
MHRMNSPSCGPTNQRDLAGVPAMLALLLVLLPSIASAQTADSVSAKDTKLLITPFAAPGYTPEQGGLVTVGALLSFRTKPLFKRDSREMVQRSTVTLNGSYSTTGAITANVKLSSYWAGDRLRAFADFVIKDMPDHYWGVGYEAGKAPEGDSTTAYHRTSLNFLPKVLWRLSPAIMVGPAFDINYTNATEVSPGMAADPYYQEYGPENQNNGIGAVFQYDTRDVAANAFKGVYVNAQVLSYGSLLGGDNDYVIYDVDYRQYLPLGRKGKTLAWTARSRWGTGSVPWAELSQLGSGNDVRGYRQGRYRDQIMAYWIVEYRHQFTSQTRASGLSRHGFVLFSSVGTVADETTDFGKLQILPGWGAGYRFEVQPRMNVRVDLAFGREFLESGNKFVPSVYFNFNEAF